MLLLLGGAGAPPILTRIAALGYPAAGAWSVARRLLSSYTGPLIRVRRDSDNAEVGIAATSAGALDEAALLAWAADANVTVVTVYDQTGNGYDLTQATAGSQPRIVAAGALDKIGTRPALKGTGAASRIESATYTHADATTISAVIDDTDGLSPTTYITRNAETTGNRSLIIGNAAVRFDGATSTTPDQTPGKKCVVGWCGGAGATTQSVDLNGAVTGPTAINRASCVAGVAWMGTYGSATQGYQRKSSELIFFNAALPDAVRRTLMHDQGTYYGITVA